MIELQQNFPNCQHKHFKYNLHYNSKDIITTHLSSDVSAKPRKSAAKRSPKKTAPRQMQEVRDPDSYHFMP